MEKITLNEYLKQGSVVENLKNFVGVTPENTVGLMTPERLAAVAGGLRYKGMITNTNIDDLKESGYYYLVEGCTPAYSLAIVLNLNRVIIQFKMQDGGQGFSSRVHVGGEWLGWRYYSSE